MQAENSRTLARSWGWLAPALAVIGLACLSWQAWRNPKIDFLPPGNAPWIVYPSPPQTRAMRVVTLPAEFHAQLVLARKPSKAMLDWCCFRDGRLTVNGQAVAIPPAANWKITARVDVAGFMRQGTNEILATVWADIGLPAVSLRLRTDEATLVTDENWNVSLAGAITLPAIRAGETVEPLAGNSLFDAGRTGPAMRRTFVFQCVFLAVASLAVWGWRRLRSPAEDAGRNERRLRNIVLTALAASWVALLAHNIPCLTHSFGFDSEDHLQYISYLQTNGALPFAEQGPEMYQAPLYYVISAGMLNVLHLAAPGLGGLRALRVFNLFVGAANVAVVWFGLGIIFPGQWRKQMAGAALVAFAPWQLYLLHYPTNEILAGTLGTASVCLALKCLTFEKDEWRPAWLAALGIVLGAACLTKASALALLPVVFMALAARWMSQRQWSPVFWCKSLALVFGVALALSAWHYARAWRHSGSALPGSWSMAAAAPWWQQPGCITPRYFDSFGRSLELPFFGGLHSFWDGLYSTFWGDGLCGGAARVSEGPPWNYDFMTAGFILALAPTLLLVSGFVSTLIAFVRRPRVDWLLLGGVAAVFLLALAEMCLKLPYYAHAKAFFALAAMLPFCALIIAGYEFWTKLLGQAAGFVLLALLGLWWINNYASFWIRPDSTQARTLAALEKYVPGKGNAAPDFQRLVELDPHNALAVECLAQSELDAGRSDRFQAVYEEAVKNNAVNGELASLAATRMATLGHLAQALELAKKAAYDLPDNDVIARTWLDLAHASQNDGEVVAAGAWYLRDNPGNLDAHAMMAEALEHLGQTDAAALQRFIGHAKVF